MKLLLCDKCWDVFKLDLDMRACKCGAVKGRYLDNRTAEVSANAISLAIGNGSLINAIGDMRTTQEYTNNQATRSEYYHPGKGRIEYAWVRPNEGAGNPNCKIIKE